MQKNKNYERISILGISGAGKSIFSRTLAQKTGLPLYHIDKLLWRGKWEEVPENEYLTEHKQLMVKDRWIIEGYIDTKMADRIVRSDLVIFMDYSGLRAAWRVFRRWLKHRKESRPELPAESKEKLEREFLWLVFTRKERQLIADAFKIAPPKELLVAKSPRQLKRIMKKCF